MRWRRKQWADEKGVIAEGALNRARMQRLDNLRLQQAARGAGFTAGLDPSQWVERGPRNVAGRTRSLLIDPSDPNRMLAGAVGGGIWKSTDGGASWSPVNDELPSLAICCLARDPGNASVLYAGTGEGFFNGDAIGGAGIYKSTDGGDTWSVLPSTTGFDNICRIAVSPANSSIILASKRFGGVLRSINGGASWSTVYGAQGSYFVAFDPNDATKAVAQVIDYDFGIGDWLHRALYSTNSGQTWTPASGALGNAGGFYSRIELAYAPSQPGWVYASTAGDGGKIWRSTDGGQSYVLRTGATSSGANWYANPLWVDPTNADVLVTGGVYFYRSTNGGTSLTRITDGYILTTQPHPDCHAIVADPGFDGTSNRRVYLTTDGGVFRTDNIYTASTASGWVALVTQSRSTQFYGAAGDGTSGRIIGGLQDNGTLRLNSGSDLAGLMYGGDGGFCAIDATNANFCYGEYQVLNVVRSVNGGNSATRIVNGLTDADSSANFIAPITLDPNNPNRLLAGGLSLWRTNNVKQTLGGGPTWASIRGPGSDYVSAIAVARGNSDIVWMGQNNGEVHRTSNGTAGAPGWTAVDNNGGTNPLPNRYVTRIVIDPDDANTAYVALGGFSPDNVWRTTNGGATWTDASGAGATGLPSAPVRGLTRHPESADWLYAGTEVGIFASGDAGATWTATDAGPANVSVDELVFMHNSNTLLAATHGRGLFTVAIPGPCTLPGDVNGDSLVDADDVAGFVRVKLGAPLPGDNAPCADYGSGTASGDAALFAGDLLS